MMMIPEADMKAAKMGMMGDEAMTNDSSLKYLPALGSLPTRPMKGIIE